MSQEDFPYQFSEQYYDDFAPAQQESIADLLVTQRNWIHRGEIARLEQVYGGDPIQEPQGIAYDNDSLTYVHNVMRLVGTIAPRGDIAEQDLRPGRHRLREQHAAHYLTLIWHERNTQNIIDMQRTYGISPEEYATRVMPIFRNTLIAMVSGPRIVARSEFETTRQGVLHGLPETPEARAELVRQGGFGSTLKLLEQAVGELPYRLAVPDFAKLEEQQQTEIVDHIGRQYLGFLQVVHEKTGASILATELFGQPAIRGQASDLQHVIASETSPPRAATRKFLYDKAAFDELVRASKEAPVVVRPPLPTLTVEQEPSQSEQEQISAQEALKMAISEQEIGETVQLRPDEMRLSRTEVSEVAAEAFEAIGYHLHNLAGGQDGPNLFQWLKTEEQTIDRLFKSFHGSNISRPRITRLPLSKADLRVQEQTGRSIVGDPRRYALTVDVKSTGRATMSISIGAMVVVRRHEIGLRVMGNRVHRTVDAKSSSEVEQLVQESNLVAGVVAAYNVSNPMQGGLPGLGKR